MDKMGTNEHELGLFIYKKFRDNLSEDFDILLDQRLKANRRADITISKGKTRLAIIEIKPRLYQRPDRKDTEDQVTNMAFYEGFRFAIIAVDENTLYIKDCFLNKNDEFKQLSFQAIFYIFDVIRNPHHVVGKKYRDAVYNMLEKLTKGNEKVEALKEKYRATPFMIDDTSFFFENEEVEDELFECFLRPFNGDRVCRYTSLVSLFRTINEGTQSMCCIVGMNDRSECTYADNYIRKQKTANIPTIKTLYDAEVENGYYILSCMDKAKYNNLTMWRLYGDNTKGVNILYNVEKKDLAGFKLYHIDYAEQPGDHGHSALNIIGSLMGLNVGGRTFKLRRWNEWKHFFKPYEYKDELEIRLLYNKMDRLADKWIMTSDYQIVCPLAIFKVVNFPLVIEEIMLGPNCPDIEVNQLQLELMLKERSVDLRLKRKNNIIQNSGIGTYRM